MENINKLSSKIIGAAIEVHKAVGPGLLESAYEVCLCHELNLQGVSFDRKGPCRSNTRARGSIAVTD